METDVKEAVLKREHMEYLTCLHSLRHSAEMASSQQPSPTQPSDFLDTPADKLNTTVATKRCVDLFDGDWLL